MARHRSPMNIYFKNRGSGCLAFLQYKILHGSKFQKVIFYRRTVTKNVFSVVNCLYFIILCVYQYNGLTHKPHDHLIQNSGQLLLGTFACNIKYSKFQKVRFYRRTVTKKVVSGVNWLYSIILCVYQYNGKTQKPHDHLFQKSVQRLFGIFAI